MRFGIRAACSAVSIFALVVHPIAVSAHEPAVADSNKFDNDSAIDARADEPQATTLQAINEAIEIWRQIGDESELAKWRAYRVLPPQIDDIERYGELLNDLRKTIQALRHRREYLSAERLVRLALLLAETEKETLPKQYGGIQFEACMVDYAFERYEQAASRLLECRAGFRAAIISSNKFERAYRRVETAILHREGRYDEALQIYSEALREAKNDPNITGDEIGDVRIALADLYIDMGRLQEAQNIMPRTKEELLGTNGEIRRERQVQFLSTATKLKLREGNVRQAANTAEWIVEQVQRWCGVASLEYVEAIELLSQVRTEESRYPEAADLLTKSADIRARLLGNDHTSVKRTLNQMSAVRRRQIEDATPIWTPLWNDNGSEAANRHEIGAPAR